MGDGQMQGEQGWDNTGMEAVRKVYGVGCGVGWDPKQQDDITSTGGQTK